MLTEAELKILTEEEQTELLNARKRVEKERRRLEKVEAEINARLGALNAKCKVCGKQLLPADLRRDAPRCRACADRARERADQEYRDWKYYRSGGTS